MRKFETLVLLSPELAAEAREALVATLSGIIEREQGAITTVDHWGMKELAYPVRKQMRGYYVRFEYNGPPALVTEFERNIRISDGIFKFVTVRLPDAPDASHVPDTPDTIRAPHAAEEVA
jgi:small subunit ribosomal protein S6